MGKAIFQQKSDILGVGITSNCGILTPAQLTGLGERPGTGQPVRETDHPSDLDPFCQPGLPGGTEEGNCRTGSTYRRFWRSGKKHQGLRRAS